MYGMKKIRWSFYKRETEKDEKINNQANDTFK